MMPATITVSQNIEGFCVTKHRQQDERADAETDRQHRARDEEEGDRARIEDAGLDQPAPQDLGVAAVWSAE